MRAFGTLHGGLAALIGLTVITACADGVGPDARRVTVSFATRPATGAFAARPLAGSAADAVVITRAWFVLEELELETETALAGCANDGGADDSMDGDGVDDSSECEIESGPYLVELPVAGTLRTELGVAIPPGRYREIEYEIDRVEQSDVGGPAFLAAHPEFQNASVRVEGTYHDRPFVYVGRFDDKIELEFQPPVVIDGTGRENITVAIDMSGWFRTGSGEFIDPASANAGGPNEGLVRSNIHASFSAYEDDDHDGRDDSSTD